MLPTPGVSLTAGYRRRDAVDYDDARLLPNQPNIWYHTLDRCLRWTSAFEV
jgi:hypothetical protein